MSIVKAITQLPLYTPLNPDIKEIRLLRVAPHDGRDAACICECTMFKASLLQDPYPEYIAMSYEWNHSVAHTAISPAVVVNGHKVQVTKNLALFLTIYRMWSMALGDAELFQIPIWVDTLCIDQANIAEVNFQVGLMGAIYSRAKATFAWLGESRDDSNYALDIISKTARKINKSMSEGANEMAWIEPEMQPELWQPDAETFPACLNRFWTGVAALMKRPYWKRAWIVQEILLQPTVLFFCGKVFVPYVHFKAIYIWLGLIKGKPCPPGVNGDIWQLLSGKHSRGVTGWTHFIAQRRFDGPLWTGTDSSDERQRFLRWKAWVGALRTQKATDPRDHLYSVLGLVGIESLQPDYAASAETVFYDFAATSIRIENNLDILVRSGHFSLQRDDSEGPTHVAHLLLPSWVPNWDKCSHLQFSDWAFDHRTRADAYWQSIHVFSGRRVPWVVDGRTLNSPGVFFDIISEMRVCNIDDGTWVSFCLDYIFTRRNETYPTGIPALQALTRLALCGRGVASGETLAPSLDAATLMLSVLPGLMAWLHASSHMGPDYDPKRLLETLGLSTHDGFVQSFIGRSPNSVARELAGELPRLRELSKDSKVAATHNAGEWSAVRSKHLDLDTTTFHGMFHHVAFVTKKGYIGWARGGFQNGDRVCVLAGCSVPVLLRKVDERYIHLGPCYVEGLMHGEAMSCVRDGTAQLETFHIM